jgi:hypothetical protein
MRDPNRIDPFLKKLGELWKLYPDFRFFQLIANIPILSGTRDGIPPYQMEEEEWEELFEKAYSTLLAMSEADAKARELLALKGDR